MPNIDHLRKQAKLYLRWHRERYYPVAARIRAVLPRYRELSDREVLDSPFRLADAQELVARTAGFESWEALRRGKHSLPNNPTAIPAMTVLTAAEPQLYVRDIAVSTEFYVRRLGFSLAFSWGEPPFYAQVFRDGARLNLRCVDAPVIDRRLRDAEQLLAATITLEDAKPLFLEYQASAVEFAEPLQSQPWGARTFIVRDPDGNLILFAGRGE
ncbi:MAG TPA: VOC family protein [Gemmatimonadaceae bacterium]|jgi:catechol 2,3-dioxygenase-like lactoylglutathione lyase family enzyme